MWRGHEVFLPFKLTMPQREMCYLIFFFIFIIYLIVLTFQPIVLIHHYSAWSIISCLVIYKIPARGENFYVLLPFLRFFLVWFCFVLYQSVFCLLGRWKKYFRLHWFNQLHGLHECKWMSLLETYCFICYFWYLLMVSTLKCSRQAMFVCH